MSADSVDRKSKNKVVAQLPKSSTLGVTTYNPRDRSSADRMSGQIWRDATKELFGESLDYDTATPAQRSAYEQKYGINQSAPVGSVDPLAAYGGLANILQGSGSGSGSGSSRNTAAMLKAIKERKISGEASAWDNYNTGIENINAGYNTAQGMVDTGYADLNKYLTTNQINPYASLQQTVSPVNNAMANYLSAYGVSNDPVTQQVQASQIAGQQSADSFKQLQQLMSANQIANNQSNLDVSKMAQNYATTGLGSQRAAYQANTETARSAAMADLMDQLFKAKLDVYK